MSDYYDVLGVSKDATQEDIKKAYRKMARSLHPDINPSPEAAEQFKEVSQAFDTLSSPEKRQAYDMGGGAGFSGFGQGFGFADIFESFMGGGGQRGPQPRQRRGNDALITTEISLPDAVFGADRELQLETAIICDSCEGTCCQAGTDLKKCSVCDGAGSTQRVARSFLGQVLTSVPCAACQGYGNTIPHPCAQCSGQGRVRKNRTLTIKVPAGVESGTRIQIRGQGEVGPAGGPTGDLFIEVHVRTHEKFTRERDDLHCTIELPMTAAALGTTLTLATLDGEKNLEIKPGTQPGEVLTLRDLGVTGLRTGVRGDLKVHLDVKVPTKLDDEQVALLTQLAALRDESHATGKMSNTHGNVFSRLKDAWSGR